MNRIMKIYLYPLFAGFLLIGCKAGNERYSDMNNEEMEFADSTSLEANYGFETDSLSDQSLKAFEVRAIQKLQDVVDLIGILSNDTNDMAFRIQAKTMLLENFDDTTNTISFPIPDSKPLQTTVSQFADSLLADQYPTLKLKIRDSYIKEPLSVLNESEYTGTIFFVLEISENNKNLYPKDMISRILLKKKTKDFGGTPTEVWEVFLGDMGN